MKSEAERLAYTKIQNEAEKIAVGRGSIVLLEAFVQDYGRVMYEIGRDHMKQDVRRAMEEYQ